MADIVAERRGPLLARQDARQIDFDQVAEQRKQVQNLMEQNNKFMRLPGQLQIDVEHVKELHPLAQQLRPRALEVQERAQRLAERQHDHQGSRQRGEVVAQPPHAVDPAVHSRQGATQADGRNTSAPIHRYYHENEEPDRNCDHRPQAERAAWARLAGKQGS